jgi:hypothetical protein
MASAERYRDAKSIETISAGTIALEISSRNSGAAALQNAGTGCAPPST